MSALSLPTALLKIRVTRSRFRAETAAASPGERQSKELAF